MKHLFIVLYKVVVLEFYRINAGFFLIAVGFCFGFLRKIEHLALAQFFISTVYLLVIPLTIWFLYSIKIIQFNRQVAGLSQNSFLSAFPLVQPFYRLVLASCVATMQLFPVMAYALFLVGVAKVNQQAYAVYTITGSLVALTSLVAYSLYQNFLHSSGDSRVSLLKRVWDANFTKPYLQFFMEWVIRSQPSLFFGVKLLGSLLLVGVARLYVYDTYDERLMSLGVLSAMAANTMIVFQFHRFENYHFRLVRQLPFSVLHSVLFFIFTFFIICLPEWIFLFQFFPATLSKIQYLEFVVFGLSFLFLSYTILFIQHTSFDRFVKRVFYGFMALMLLILFRVPVMAFVVLHVLVGTLFIRKYYYTFEFMAGEEV